jgi:hypothetical protein
MIIFYGFPCKQLDTAKPKEAVAAAKLEQAVAVAKLKRAVFYVCRFVHEHLGK